MILWLKVQRNNAKHFMRPHVPPNMSKNSLASLLEIPNVKNCLWNSAELGARLKKVSKLIYSEKATKISKNQPIWI